MDAIPSPVALNTSSGQTGPVVPMPTLPVVARKIEEVARRVFVPL